MRVHLHMPASSNRANNSWGVPRAAFWVTATEAEVEEHLRPLLHGTCRDRYDSWRSDPRFVEDEAIQGRWAFLVPAQPSAADPPIFFFSVFPYSAMNDEKETYRRIPGEMPYDDKDHPWLRGVEIQHLGELEKLIERLTDPMLAYHGP